MKNKYYTFKAMDGVHVSNGDAPLYLIGKNYVYSVRFLDTDVIIGTVNNNNIILNKRNPSALRILKSCGYKVSYSK